MGYLLVRILSANGLTYFQYTFPFIPLLIYGVCLNNIYYNFCYLSKNSMQKFIGGTDQNSRLILKCPSVVTFHPDFR